MCLRCSEQRMSCGIYASACDRRIDSWRTNSHYTFGFKETSNQIWIGAVGRSNRSDSVLRATIGNLIHAMGLIVRSDVCGLQHQIWFRSMVLCAVDHSTRSDYYSRPGAIGPIPRWGTTQRQICLCAVWLLAVSHSTGSDSLLWTELSIFFTAIYNCRQLPPHAPCCGTRVNNIGIARTIKEMLECKWNYGFESEQDQVAWQFLYCPDIQQVLV